MGSLSYKRSWLTDVIPRGALLELWSWSWTSGKPDAISIDSTLDSCQTYTLGADVVACDDERRALMRAFASKMELGTVDLLRENCTGCFFGAEVGTRMFRATLIGIVVEVRRPA